MHLNSHAKCRSSRFNLKLFKKEKRESLKLWKHINYIPRIYIGDTKGCASFVEPFDIHLCFMCTVVMQLWGHLLGKGCSLGSLVLCFLVCLCTFPDGGPGQAWFLIVSISDLCLPL